MLLRRFLRLLPAIAALLALPAAASAQAIPIERVIGGLPNALTGANMGEIFQNVMLSFVGLADVVGLFMIVRAGLKLTIGQGEDEMGKAKKTIGAVAGALILLNLVPILQVAFLSYAGGGGGIIAGEIEGLVSFLETFAGGAAIIYIVVSGIRAVTSWGGEDGISYLKKTFYGVIAGVVVIAAKFAIRTAVYEAHEPSGLITIIVRIITNVLALGALVATVVIIYAGLLMIVNFGKDEQYTRAKNLVFRVAIGLVVILASYAIVTLVIG